MNTTNNLPKSTETLITVGAFITGVGIAAYLLVNIIIPYIIGRL